MGLGLDVSIPSQAPRPFILSQRAAGECLYSLSEWWLYRIFDRDTLEWVETVACHAF